MLNAAVRTHWKRAVYRREQRENSTIVKAKPLELQTYLQYICTYRTFLLKG